MDTTTHGAFAPLADEGQRAAAPAPLRTYSLDGPGVRGWRIAMRDADFGGWTIRDAAQWCGTSARQWERYERGENAVPSALALLMVAMARDRGIPYPWTPAYPSAARSAAGKVNGRIRHRVDDDELP